MGGYFTATYTIPVPAETTKDDVVRWLRDIATDDEFQEASYNFSNLIPDERTEITFIEFEDEPLEFELRPGELIVHVSQDMSYCSAVDCDNLNKELYKHYGDHSRVFEADTECDGEEDRCLLAPENILLAFQIAELESEAKDIAERLSELRERLPRATDQLMEG